MNARLLAATTRRVLLQLRADPRTIALILVVPALLLTLLRFVYDADQRLFGAVAVTLLAILPMMVMFLITSVAMLRERTSGTLERLLTTPLHRADLIGGYAVAFMATAATQSVVLTLVAHLALGVDTAAPLGWVVLVAAFSAVVGVAFGLLASAFARTEFQAVQFMPVFIGPQIFLCGLFAPRDAMPDVLRWASSTMPMTYAVDALRDVAAHESVGTDFAGNLTVLGVVACGALILAAWTMRRSSR